MLTLLIKIALLMLSNLGYWEFFRSKSRLNVYFLPAFTIGTQFLVLFAAGVLNFLAEAAYAVYILGLLLFLGALRKEKGGLLKPYLNWGYGFLAVVTVLAALEVRGQLFSLYDSFSHWALVVRNILSTDGFPNFADEVITFQSYPLGSASYLYYFCKMIGTGEDVQMLAQVFMTLCMILPLFAYVKKNPLVCTVFLTLLTNFFLCYISDILDISVDTLLPLTGMAAVLLLHHECLAPEEAERRSVFYAVPLLCLTVQIKNSGIFFAAAGAVLLLASMKKDRKDILSKLAVAASPAAVLLLWSRHCDYVFARAAATKHSMRADWYSSIFAEKSPEDIRIIVGKVAKYAVTRKELLCLVLWLAVLGIMVWLFAGALKKPYLRLLAWSAGLYVVYVIGIMGMYLFSMPLEEALSVGSLSRYAKTLDIALYYLMACCAVSVLSRTEEKRLRAAAGTVLVVLMVGTWGTQLGSFKTIFEQSRVDLHNSIQRRLDFEEVLAEYGVPAESSYFICIPEEDYGYIYFLCKYLMDSANLDAVLIREEAQLEQAREYEFFINLDEDNPVIQKWLEENFPGMADKQVLYIA